MFPASHVFLCSPRASAQPVGVMAPPEVIIAESADEARETYEGFWRTPAGAAVSLRDLEAVEAYVKGRAIEDADLVLQSGAPAAHGLRAFCVTASRVTDAGVETRPLLVFARDDDEAIRGVMFEWPGAVIDSAFSQEALDELLSLLRLAQSGEAVATVAIAE